MRVRVMDGLGTIYELPATRVLVVGDDGTPVMVAVELMDRVIKCAHVLDKDFHQTLRATGVDRTTIMDPLRPRPAAEILAS